MPSWRWAQRPTPVRCFPTLPVLAPQDVSEENAELALGAKANAGALPAGAAAAATRRSSLRRSRSSLLPAAPFYEGQLAAAAGGPPDGYGEPLALQPVTEADAADNEEVRCAWETASRMTWKNHWVW